MKFLYGCFTILFGESLSKKSRPNKWIALEFLKKLWCCVGGRVKRENLVLSNGLIKFELPPRMIWKADVSSVSPSSER